MKRFFPLFVSVVLLTATPLTALAVPTSPLRLDYSVQDLGGGLFDYDFTLVLDNNDGKWKPGDGWGWIIFGDSPTAPSPLSDFALESVDLPFTGITPFPTSGSHNGPTLSPVSISNPVLWIPTDIGNALTWSGTSSADLLQDELFFSTLQSSPGAKKADFQIAFRIEAPVPPPDMVPEAATLVLLAAGLIGLTGFGRHMREI